MMSRDQFADKVQDVSSWIKKMRDKGNWSLSQSAIMHDAWRVLERLSDAVRESPRKEEKKQ